MRKKHFLMIALVLLLLFALLQIDRDSLIYSISQVPPWLILVMIGLQILTQILINLQWYKIARLTGKSISFLDMLRVNCAGAVMDSITPGVKIGGEVTRAVQISRIGNCPGEEAASVVALQKMFSMGALVLILLVVALQMHVLFYGVILLVGLIFVVAIALKKASHFSWMRKVRGFLVVLKEHAGNLRKNKRACLLTALLSLFIWLLYPLKMILIASQFAPEVGFATVAGITFAAYMVAMIPIFPGGLGGFEGTMSGLLVAAGVVVSDAAVMTIFFRFITFWFVMLLGLAILLISPRKSL